MNIKVYLGLSSSYDWPFCCSFNKVQYSSMNLKRFIFTFRSSSLLQLESVENMLELLGILGTFKIMEQSYPSSRHSKPWSLSLL